MYMSGKIKWKQLIICLLIPLAVGLLAGVLTRNSVSQFDMLTKPLLTPPSVVFPVVWTILYLLMGVSSYLVYTSKSEYRQIALNIYIIQLFFNFMWSIFFFGFELRLVAFIWLVILWLLVIEMLCAFKRVNPAAAYLQIPYLVWVTFAGYLNLGTYLLNK